VHARARLLEIDQSHVLQQASSLSTDRLSALLGQLDSVDLSSLPRLIRQYVTSKPKAEIGSSIEPVDAYGLNGKRTGTHATWDRAAAHASGVDQIRRGKVAAFTVAGGQGSRLGFEGPKGCYPAGAVSGKSLFAALADWILAAEHRFSSTPGSIPWFIMTSPANHQQTINFFSANHYFGLLPGNVFFFPQGQMPSLDMATGRMLMASDDTLALNPDGHGGSIKALHASGACAEMARRGVEQLCYVQIDNPLVRVIDPVFIGLHSVAADSAGLMSSKFVRKTDAAEKVGLLCRVDGQTAVIEYSDAPAEMQNAKTADGKLKFNAGSIAIHMISRRFIEQLNESADSVMPYHRAEKKVPYYDLSQGKMVSTGANNAVKLETFVFDALPLAGGQPPRGSIVMETDRIDEFAPIKNADGNDSPQTCAAIQTARAAAWLEASGVAVPRKPDGTPDCTIELSPRLCFDAAEVAHRVGSGIPGAIERGSRTLLA